MVIRVECCSRYSLSRIVYKPTTLITTLTSREQHQQNVKTTPGPPRGVMVPLVLLVHLDPPWSTFLVKFEKVWIRMDQSGPRSEIFLMATLLSSGLS